MPACEYRLVSTTDGLEALRVLDAAARGPPSERFHLVLSDVVMEGMGGAELIVQIRERYGDGIAIIRRSSV
jgi:CheY-like chemotaxis protein